MVSCSRASPWPQPSRGLPRRSGRHRERQGFGADRAVHTGGRTRTVSKAQSFLTGAELALGVGDDPLLDLPGVAAALAVLAGAAAADAACCAALGERSRGQAHQEAIALVRTVRPHGVQRPRSRTTDPEEGQCALRHDLDDGHRSARDDRLGPTTHHLCQRDRRRMTRALRSPLAPVSLDEPALVQG
jgi:hypothetical protein